MLSIVNMKIYRKFLMLAVLSVSLFVLSSTNQSATLPLCCTLWHACDDESLSCAWGCAALFLPQSPTKYQECASECEAENFSVTWMRNRAITTASIRNSGFQLRKGENLLC
jgi:hypothetical protein